MRSDDRPAQGHEGRGAPREGSGPSRPDAGRGSSRDQGSESRQAPPRSESRGPLRDLLGDFSEQTGSQF